MFVQMMDQGSECAHTRDIGFTLGINIGKTSTIYFRSSWTRRLITVIKQCLMNIYKLCLNGSQPHPDAASEILGKERRRKKPWVTKYVLDLCDERRDLKKKRYEEEGEKNSGKQTGGFRRQ